MGSEAIIVPALFSMVAFVVWIVANGWQRRHQMRLMTEFNNKLLDRVGSAKEFGEFLQSEVGSKFIDNLKVERSPTRAEHGILRASQIGIVLTMLGLGLLAVGRYLTYRYSAFDEYEPLTILGVVALSLGLGFLFSAVASYRLGRTLGVLGPGPRDRG
jgi:hypothetical protein